MHKREDVRVLQDEFSVRKGLRGMPGAFLTEDDAAVVLDLLAGLRERIAVIARGTAEMKRHLADEFNNRRGSMSQRIMWQGTADVCKAQAALLDEFAAELDSLPLLPSDGPPEREER